MVVVRFRFCIGSSRFQNRTVLNLLNNKLTLLQIANCTASLGILRSKCANQTICEQRLVAARCCTVLTFEPQKGAGRNLFSAKGRERRKRADKWMSALTPDGEVPKFTQNDNLLTHGNKQADMELPSWSA